MAKRLMALLGMLALLLAAALPAAAQQYQYGPQGEFIATGVLGENVQEGPDPTPVYPIIDEASGAAFELQSGFVDLGSYVGQKVTVYGTSTPGIGTPPRYDVIRVEPADGRGNGSEASVLGTVTDVSGSVVLVEEDPSAESGDKGYFTVTDDTQITLQRDGASAPAAFEDLAVGQLVEAAYDGAVAESYPTQGNAASIAILEDIDCPFPGGCGGEGPVAVAFELAVEGEPPADATFFASLGYEPAYFPLTDPDGDGLYAATTPEGLVPAGDVQPARILQGTGTRASRVVGAAPGEPVGTIKDFGEVRFDEDTTLSANVSFGDDGGSDDGGSKGAPVVSGDGNDDKGGGSADDSEGADRGSSPVAEVLPATGGVLPAAALGAMLIAGGLIARRIYR
ncbi:MAG: YobA family protein [Actinomycetota bacterium]|nr:YobA family protein [Actinomycetota bacterium]